MNIPVFIYKILAPIISPTVSMLFYNSVSEGIFPECSKTSKIIPIFKSGDSNFTVNYRPISMLPFLSKIYEKLMCARLDSHLKSNNIYVQISLASAKIEILQMQLFVATATWQQPSCHTQEQLQLLSAVQAAFSC